MSLIEWLGKNESICLIATTKGVVITRQWGGLELGMGLGDGGKHICTLLRGGGEKIHPFHEKSMLL